MPNVLGSAGSWSFVLSNRWGCGGLAVRGDCTSSPPSPLPLSLPFKLLRRHHRARARGAARRHAMGGYYRDRDRGSDRDRRPADREESSDLRRRRGGAARCSAVTRRRWLRDGGRGGAGLSRRGACCCGVRIVFFLFSSSGRRAPAKRAAAAPPPSSPLQRPGQAGDENTPPPLRIAPQAPAGNKGATRGRVFFVTAWQRGGPMPGGFSPFPLFY